jgi:membrane associated rhomboid family serine protease
VTSGFLHANLMHVGFNGLLLWQLGHLLEPLLGRGRFLALYAAGLAGGRAPSRAAAPGWPGNSRSTNRSAVGCGSWLASPAARWPR